MIFGYIAITLPASHPSVTLQVLCKHSQLQGMMLNNFTFSLPHHLTSYYGFDIWLWSLMSKQLIKRIIFSTFSLQLRGNWWLFLWVAVLTIFVCVGWLKYFVSWVRLVWHCDSVQRSAFPGLLLLLELCTPPGARTQPGPGPYLAHPQQN